MATQVLATMQKQLKNPFDPKFVKFRVGATNAEKTSGIALAYIDSREVKKRLDEVMGINNWYDKLIRVDGGFICELYLRIDGEWICRSNAGEDSQVAAVKGGASDAFKRAAAMWGIGHYLYYLPTLWVPIKAQGKSYVLAEQPELPDWAQPSETEDWQDLAEMEADLTSGVDAEEIAGVVIENIDRIRDAKTVMELDAIEAELSEADKLILVNELAIKRRKLEHDARVHSDNS